MDYGRLSRALEVNRLTIMFTTGRRMLRLIQYIITLIHVLMS